MTSHPDLAFKSRPLWGALGGGSGRGRGEGRALFLARRGTLSSCFALRLGSKEGQRNGCHLGVCTRVGLGFQ